MSTTEPFLVVLVPMNPIKVSFACYFNAMMIEVKCYEVIYMYFMLFLLIVKCQCKFYSKLIQKKCPMTSWEHRHIERSMHV